MTRTLPPLALALLAAACSHASSDDRVLRHAAARLGVPASELRVSAESDLTGMRHEFDLITRNGAPVLVVVVPRDGDLFDSRLPDAFNRVSVGEGAVKNLSRLGAERVALWFGALGGSMCPNPSSDEAHFTKVTPSADGLRIEYPAGGDKNLGITRTCVIELAVDGSLKAGRLVEDHAPQASANGWHRSTN